MTGRAVRCRVCQSADLPAIDAALAGGEANTRVAERHGLSKDSVRRHREEHLPKALAAVRVERERAGAISAVARAEDLFQRASRVLESAEGEGKAALSLSAIKELRSCVELLARLSGELDERATVQVVALTADPQYLQARATIFAALRPFPEAAQAVARALQGAS